jgi:hypothetical protein
VVLVVRPLRLRRGTIPDLQQLAIRRVATVQVDALAWTSHRLPLICSSAFKLLVGKPVAVPQVQLVAVGVVTARHIETFLVVDSRADVKAVEVPHLVLVAVAIPYLDLVAVGHV